VKKRRGDKQLSRPCEEKKNYKKGKEYVKMKCLENEGGKFVVFVLPVLFMFSMISSGAFAAEFSASDDTYIVEAFPNGVNGTKSHFRVRGTVDAKMYAFLKFTVSGVSGVTNAKLKIRVEDSAIDNTSVYAVTGTWDESTLNWTNCSLSWGSLLDSKSSLSASTWYEFDVNDSVTGNGTYTFGLKTTQDATNLDWYSEESAYDPLLIIVEGDTTPPAAPTGLGATPGDTQVALDWNDNTEGDLASYSVYRDTSTGGPYSLVVSGLTNSNYTNTGLTNDTTYYYVVTAVDTNDNESADSSEDSATPEDTMAPAAPTGLGATAGNTQVALDWNNNTEEDFASYSVYRSTTSGSYGSPVATGVTTSDYNDTGLTNDTTYYYKVTAVDDSSNESAKSSEVSATPTAGGGGTDEFNPSDDSFVNESNPTANFGSNTYLNVRDTSSAHGRWPFLKFTVSGVSGTVTSAKLKLYSQDVTQTVYAKAVSNTSWTEGAITWNNKPSVGSTLDTKTPSASSWVEFDVTSHVTGNGTYSFCLQGSTDTGQQFDSKENTHDPILEVTYGGGDSNAPAAPTGLFRTAGDAQVSLDWDDNTEEDLASYSVWRDTSTGGPYTEIASDLTTSAYTDTGRTNNTTYYYVVTAVDTSENESDDSIEVSAKPQAYQYARPNSDRYNSDSFTKADRSTTTNIYTEIDEVTRNDNNYIVSPTVNDPDMNYWYHVWLSNVSDPGVYSGDEDHVFSYAFRTAVDDATEAGPQSFAFQLYQDDPPSGEIRICSYNEHKSGHQTEWTRRDRKLQPEEIALITDYSKLHVRIKINAQGDTGENGACSWIQLKVPPAKATVPTAPSGLSATTASDKYINLSWTDNSSNEDGFFIERKLTSGGTWERLYPVIPPNAESYSARVAPSTNYTFRVCAYNSGGDSSYSGTDSATSSSHTATSYYVATTGDDDNAGTYVAPFATIQKGVDMLSAGDTLYIRGGTYHEQVKLVALTGTSANRITIRDCNNETVTLDGTEEITSSWSQHSGNIYKTTLNKDIWQLFVDGRMMTPARWPNADNPMDTDSNHWDKYATWGQMDVNHTVADHMYHTGSPSLSGTGKSFQGGIAILNTGGWVTYAKEITSHTAGQNHFIHDYTSTFGRFIHYSYYYIEGDLDCLDAAEEWFYDPSTKVLYLYAAGGVDPDTLNNIRGKTQNYAMELDYCEYLRIRGLKFYGNTLRSDEGRQLIINKCTFTYPSFRPTMLGIEYISDHEEDAWYRQEYFDGQTVIRNTSDVNTQNVVKNCTFEYTDGLGLDMMKGGEDVIENNYFQYIDFSGLGQTTANLQINDDSVFRRNTVHTTSASETFRLGPRGLAEYNHMWNTGNLQNDGALFQIRWENQNGSIVRYNWGHDTIKIGHRFDGAAAGQGNDHGLVHHNVFMGCEHSGLRVKGDYHETYCNTAFDSGSYNDIVIKRYSNDGLSDENLNSTTKNNACYTLEGAFTGDMEVPGTVNHNWVGNDLSPTKAMTTQLRDPANFDFRPKSGSDIRDAGVVISGITDGYLGSAPDIGAYEYNCSSYWIPGCKFEKASTPVPPDGATGVKRACDPAWLEALDATDYDIYFGTSSPGTFIQNQSSNLYDRTTSLSASTTYYWRIDANTPSGMVTGDVWTFTTGN
jgi:fibronectin type 3 domain-containing protein